MIKGIVLSVIIFALLLFAVSQSVNLPQVLGLLTVISIEKIIIIICISGAITLIRSWRFAVLVKKSHINVSFWQVLKVFISGQATTQLPGGEVVRGLLLSREGEVGFKTAAAPVISQAYLELLAPALLMLLGSFFFPSMLLPALIMAGLMIMATVVMLSPSLALKLQKIIPDISIVKKTYDLLLNSQKDVRGHFVHHETGYPTQTFGVTLFLSVISTLGGGVLLYVITIFLNEHITFFQAAFIYAASVVIQSITIPGGIGFTEGGMLGLLLLLDVDFPVAVAIVLLFRVSTLLLSVLIGLLFLITFYGKALYQARFDVRKL